jgi:ferrochelatase
MRYWHPFTAQTVADVKDWAPDEILLLPLYPQFSTTTTASSLAAWHNAARFLKLSAPTRAICCYPTEPGFIEAMARAIQPILADAERHGTPRLLLSAHGLPEKIVKGGDPYQFQCEQTATAIVEALGSLGVDIKSLNWTVCYQSRVGPLKWIGPSTDDEIRRAGEQKESVVVAPIAFVSEHSETLVELEIEYRKLAEDCGVPAYRRVPAVATAPAFIAGLARLVRAQAPDRTSFISGCGKRICPPSFRRCPLKHQVQIGHQ